LDVLAGLQNLFGGAEETESQPVPGTQSIASHVTHESNLAHKTMNLFTFLYSSATGKWKPGYDMNVEDPERGNTLILYTRGRR